MRRSFASFCALALLTTATPAFAVMEDYPSIKLQGLDKSVGRTVTFEAKVGSTIQYGPLFIKIHACRKAPPIEKPESAAFLQIWEVPPGQDTSEWVFSGWMFASSPALSAMDHPVYDVWVLDCLGKEQPNEEAKAAETSEQADQTNLPAPDPDAPTVPATESPTAPSATPAPENEQEPIPAEEIPTDSEADDSDAGGPMPVTPPVPATAPQSEADPTMPMGGLPETAAPAPETPPQDPTSDGNFTAYDLMKQQGTNAAPPTAPAPEPYPTYDPQAPVPSPQPATGDATQQY